MAVLSSEDEIEELASELVDVAKVTERRMSTAVSIQDLFRATERVLGLMATLFGETTSQSDFERVCTLKRTVVEIRTL